MQVNRNRSVQEQHFGRVLQSSLRTGMKSGRALLFSAMLFALPALVALPGSSSYAQAAAAKTSIDDTWQGTLHAGKDLRTVLKITKAPDGSLKSLFYSIDQGGQPFPVKTTRPFVAPAQM